MGNSALPPVWASCLRLALASLILNGILLVTKQKWPVGAQLKAALFYGLFEFGMSFPLLYWAEARVSSGVGAIVFATCPVTAMVTSHILGLDRIDARKMTGAALAFIGVAMIFWREAAAGVSLAGLLAALGAGFSAPMAGIALERAPAQSAIASNAVGATLGTVVCGIISLALGEQLIMPTQFSQAFPIVYLAVLGSVGAFVMFAWLVNRWGTSRCSFIGVITPIIAVALGAGVAHEALTAATLIGAVIVLSGVALALTAPRVRSVDLARDL
jgi:drug/metabolite transporter (DMT)-like permease